MPSIDEGISRHSRQGDTVLGEAQMLQKGDLSWVRVGTHWPQMMFPSIPQPTQGMGRIKSRAEPLIFAEYLAKRFFIAELGPVLGGGTTRQGVKTALS